MLSPTVRFGVSFWRSLVDCFVTFVRFVFDMIFKLIFYRLLDHFGEASGVILATFSRSKNMKKQMFLYHFVDLKGVALPD